MNWQVVLFESKRREKPVEEFIKSLDEQTIAKILHKIDLLEKYGTFLGMPHVKKVTANLYELRIRGKQEIRIFYGFIKSKIYLVHAFTKQTKKTPKKEIEIATERLKIVLDTI